jgi:hypothetical protein
MIAPTIGRVVLFRPAGSSSSTEPYPALICKVWNYSSINVGGFDASGVPFSASSVILLQDNDEPPAAGPWAEWMPYQKGQAAKTEALQEQLSKAVAT